MVAGQRFFDLRPSLSADSTIKGKASLESLEALVSNVRSIDEFLGDEELVNQYAAALELYFGKKRFTRSSFSLILAQLKEVLELVPSLKERIWRSETPYEFSFSSHGESLGRDVDPFLWRLFWRNYQNGLKKQLQGSAQTGAELKKATNEYSLRVKNFMNVQLCLAGPRVAKSERRFLERQFFKEICSEKSLKVIVAQSLLNFFSLPENRQLLHIGDGDLILYFLKDLRQNPRKIFATCPEIELVPGLLGVVRSMLPNPKVLLRDLQLFPLQDVCLLKNPKMEAGRVKESQFRTVRVRPFHALWLGIPGNDCLAGNAVKSTPQRWLVAIAKGAMTSVIERDGTYQGFIRCTPVSNPSGQSFGSIEIWSPLMIRKILVPGRGAKSGTLQLTPLFDVWFPQFAAGLPPQLRELVISESKMIDNFGIKEVIARSAFYATSRVIGASATFRSSDAIVEKVAREFSSSEVVGRYGEGTVFDAKIRDAGNLRLLNRMPDKEIL